MSKQRISKEQILEKIRQCAQHLGRNPRQADLYRLAGVTEYKINRYFGTFTSSLREAGLAPHGSGYAAPTSELLLAWAAVVRELGRVPSLAEYGSGRTFSRHPFITRFEKWCNVPRVFRQYVHKQGIQSDWLDVLKLVSQYYRSKSGIGRKFKLREKNARSAARGVGVRNEAARSEAVRNQASCHEAARNPAVRNEAAGSEAARGQATSLVSPTADQGWNRRRVRKGRAVYGAPLMVPGMAHEPTNESGVVFVFGLMARSLGIVVQRIQPEFPDCEALLQVDRGRWQSVRIEFEFASRNFLHHGHSAKDCDLIVCWVHNWPDCPRNLEVIELRKIISSV
ncbi:MAG TPA: hypothetical protein VFK06_19965 [Candidatus Angelobacter sp.]|nr:hypothetical protein [Candidatus Angelobacter sp.]